MSTQISKLNLTNPFSLFTQTLFSHAPEFEQAIKAGTDARHLWFALQNWRGDDAEGFFEDLGQWAERRMADMGVDT